jgi:hypothetical protein
LAKREKFWWCIEREKREKTDQDALLVKHYGDTPYSRRNNPAKENKSPRTSTLFEKKLLPYQ